MNPLHSREKDFEKIKQTKYDLIIIGGGVTGAGIALDAVSRGLKVLLVEKGDFASGTSSKSTKLIHGGLRYLKQFEIGLVREVGRERAIVHKLCPHLVVPEKMLLPLYEDGSFGKFATSLGLWVYDFLADVEGEDKRMMLTKEETLEHEPLLKKEKLTGGGFYAEYRTDDARLTIEIIKTARQFGADVLNYAEAVSFLYNNEGQVEGIEVKDHLFEKNFKVKAGVVVSAAGPWVDELRKKDGSLSKKRLFLSKGVHIVVPHDRFPVKNALYFDVPDGRMIFAIPRWNVTYIGTTDTPYSGDKNRVLAEEKDVKYLMDACNLMFPEVNLSKKDLSSTWAGLRPLIYEEDKSASEMSRKDEIFKSQNGLISIAGGKLTGYRKMAERTVDVVIENLKKEHQVENLKPCKTDQIPIGRKPLKNSEEVNQCKSEIATLISRHFSNAAVVADYLVANYGKEAFEIVERFPNGLVNQWELIKAEIDFCIKNELTFLPLDFLNRRSGRLYFDLDVTEPHIDQIVHYFAEVFEWSESKLEAQKNLVARTVQDAKVFN
ncbi:MAG: glycerol-3-phosphate dehydrogenase/oxidase [Saprospiraceae bacterium]